MKFRTEYIPAPAPFRLDHNSRIFMTGSCFAENIYTRLHDAKFSVYTNPTGILFNPASMAQMFASIGDDKEFTREDIRSDGNAWFGWQHHGSFSDVCADAALRKMNTALAEGRAALRNADYVIITFGTAWIYRLAETGEVVANCHKQSSELFRRERLSIAEISDEYGRLLDGMLKDKKVIFTISPVRHMKDGFEENSLSKAILRTAVGELVGKYGNAYYFPAFEILTDDLRDYRFYAGDMVHPSDAAVDYVWEKFCDWSMIDNTRKLAARLEKLSVAMKHRVMEPGSAENARFAENMLSQVAALERELPGVDFSAEKEYFRSLM